MSLSDKRKCNPNDIKEGYYSELNVKEFIKELKKRIKNEFIVDCPERFFGIMDNLIDKLAGEKLI